MDGVHHTIRFPFCAAALLFALVSHLGLRPVSAQMQDSFEGGIPRWRLVESDCNAQLTLQEISVSLPRSGQTCELLQVSAGNGTFVYVAYPIEPCVVVDEFQPRVWTQCASAGIRIGVRVVFPTSFHPVTGGRLTAIVWGDTYSDTGEWQALKLTNLQKQFEAEVVALRQRYGPSVNVEDAFIDSVVMNVYTGPGGYRVKVDDLNLQGHISLPSVGRPIPTNWREAWLWRPESVNPEGRFWTVMNRPEVWLHYQGESLPWLKSLGITGLVLNRLPSEEQLQAIHEARLSVVSPPPQTNIAFNAVTSTAIRGWLIGTALDSSQTEMAREHVGRLALLPTELKRPVFGEALEQFWSFSRIADEVIVPIPDLMSAGEAREHVAWLRSQLAATKQTGSGWVATNTGVDPQWLQQIRTAQMLVEPERFDNPSSMETPTNPLGLRQQMIRSIAAGATGITLRSQGPDERPKARWPQTLELNSTPGRAQVAALRWTINDLTLWGPWIVAGQQVRAPTVNRSDFAANAWLLHNSYLIVAQRMPDTVTADSADSPANAPLGSPLVCAISTSTNSREVFRVTYGEYERIETTPTPGGLQWTIARPADVETFVISENPNVTRFVNRFLAQNRLSTAEDQLEVAAYQLSIASEILVARFPNSTEPIARAQFAMQASASRQLEEGLQAMRAGSAPAASVRAMQSMSLSQAIIDDARRNALTSLESPQASPFVLQPTALQYHWKIAAACERSQWRDLPIAGADMASLDAMLDAGWSKEQRLHDEAEMSVQWVPDSNESARGLRLAAYQKGELALPGGYEGASLRIRSAAAKVTAGQLVRISGRARVRYASPDPSSGLLVYDNQVGPGLGQLVRGQPGELKEIQLYRFIVHDGDLHVLAECRGQCDIVLEGLSASVIEPATNRQSFPTAPAIPQQFGSDLRPDSVQAVLKEKPVRIQSPNAEKN